MAILCDDIEFVHTCLKNYVEETKYPITISELMDRVDFIAPIKLNDVVVGVFGVQTLYMEKLGKVADIPFVYVAKHDRRLFNTIAKYILNYLENDGYTYVQSFLNAKTSIWCIKKLNNFPLSYLHLANIKETLNRLEVK